MNPEVSVIICTHQPKLHYFERVLESLRLQTLPPECWELLIIDNASAPPLPASLAPAWHPAAQIIAEPQPGLGSARVCGMAHSTAPLLIFVDDDNVLDPDYLEVAVRIARDWPMLGVWGGQQIAEFETPPPKWAEPYLGYLALRTLDEDVWSRIPFDKRTLPFGAGMCVRRCVADKYREITGANGSQRLTLDRQGNHLYGAVDLDISLTARDSGLGSGLFQDLKLLHLISAGRLTESYFLRLLEDLAYSQEWMEHLRGFPRKTEDRSDLLFRRYKLLRTEARARRFAQAAEQGAALARREILAIEGTLP